MRSFNRISMPGRRIAAQVLKAKSISHLALGVFERLVWLCPQIDGSLPWKPASIIAIAQRKC